jgi:hypothetical protein
VVEAAGGLAIVQAHHGAIIAVANPQGGLTVRV